MHDDSVSVTLRMKGMIARFVGIATITLGFVIGIYGLEDTEAPWLQTSLALLATGTVAQGYALYCSVKRAREIKGQPKL